MGSSYLEGRRCELAQFGYSRDHRRDRPQIVFGLLCTTEGCPVAVEVFISTHLPPPVMIERTALRALVTHMLCCSWAMCFSAATFSENDHGSMNLASLTPDSHRTAQSLIA